MSSKSVSLFLVAVTAVAFMAGAQDAKTAPFPRVGAYEVLKCDFHIHTKYSDGELTTIPRVEEAVEHGYDAIAITDHGNFKSYEKALPRANELGLVLIRGMETGLKDREHLVALNLDPSYKPKNPHNWALTKGQKTVCYQAEWPKLAKEARAFVIYAHPQMGFSEPVQWAIKQGFVQGIEVKNGVVEKKWNTVNSHGTWFYPQALDWAIEHNLTLFANSDLHAPKRTKENSPATLVLAKTRSPEGVMEALGAGRTAAWFDGMLWGKKETVEPLIKAAVIVAAKDGKVTIENKCPAALTAAVGEKTAAIDPGKSAQFESASTETRVHWTNVWVSSKDNLETVH